MLYLFGAVSRKTVLSANVQRSHISLDYCFTLTALPVLEITKCFARRKSRGWEPRISGLQIGSFQVRSFHDHWSWGTKTLGTRVYFGPRWFGPDSIFAHNWVFHYECMECKERNLITSGFTTWNFRTRSTRVVYNDDPWFVTKLPSKFSPEHGCFHAL